MIRVLLADDHPVFRRGLTMLLPQEASDFEVVGSVSNGEEVLLAMDRLKPDVVLLDARMPGLDGIQTTGHLKSRWPDIKVVILTTFEDRAIVQDALAAGADGFLLKDSPVSSIVHAMRLVLAGDRYMSDAALRILAGPGSGTVDEDARQAQRLVSQLTIRQQEVLHLLGQGKRNNAIADILCISERTVRNHVSQIYDIIGIHDRVQAILWARSYGMD